MTDQPNPPRRLYGQPWDEVLYAEVSDWWEAAIEPYGIDPDAEYVLVEHSVTPPRRHLDTSQPVPDLIEAIEERMAEWGEVCGFEDGRSLFPLDDPEILAAAEHLYDVIASRFAWRQADEEIARHTVTVVDGEPHIDGTPIYGRAVQS